MFAAPSGDGWKSRKKLRNENDRLKTQIAALEAELAAYRQEAAVRESITEELSGENENKVSAALEDYTTANTDSLLGRWYMHRSSKYGSREQSRQFCGSFYILFIYIFMNISNTFRIWYIFRNSLVTMIWI